MKPKLNLHQKLWKGLGSPVINISVKKYSLLGYVFKFFGVLAGQCDSVVVRGRNKELKVPGSRSEFDPRLLLLIEALSTTGQKFSYCLKNGSNRLRKGQEQRRLVNGKRGKSQFT